MGFVLVAPYRNASAVNSDCPPRFAEFCFGATYFFLYPQIKILHAATGELIDPQQTAFFAGSALAQLQCFIAAATEMAARQQPEWQQRVGVSANGEVLYLSAARNDVLEFVHSLEEAARTAEDRQMGVLFVGE
jgi:hypothetical protein